jgi:exodeoxyribonuclease V alpha subunit
MYPAELPSMNLPLTIQDSSRERSSLERHFATCLKDLCPGLDDLSVKVAMQLIAIGSAGAVCLDLRDMAGQPDGAGGYWPSIDALRSSLTLSPVVGRPGDFRPLILDDDRLYLARYWEYETRLARNLLKRSRQEVEGLDLGLLKAELQRCFSAASSSTEGQRLAVALAVMGRLCIISGGPGTGKTSTVIRVLLVLQALHDGKLRIAMAAPTGKAAARLTESIRTQKAQHEAHPYCAAIPEEACTIHRLLGSQPDSIYFKFNRDRPLAFDVVVLDEASMVDMALMAKLVDALPATARFILLGDKDQLAAVEAGSVFGDLCRFEGYSEGVFARLAPLGEWSEMNVSTSPDSLSDHVVLLSHSYRFGSESGIGRLARLVNAGDHEGCLELMDSGAHADLVWRGGREPMSPETLKLRMIEGYASYFEAVDAGRSPADVLGHFRRFRVLTAHRAGPQGAEDSNLAMENWRRQRLGASSQVRWYPGRAVMIRRNDYGIRLFNGDVGICLKVEGELLVFFDGADGSIRSLAPGRIPEHEAAFAMTVHKSQGSEFDEVLLILPERPSPVADRPLVYTGITRARERVELWASASSFKAAVNQVPATSSGLTHRLR